jgi:iron complex transport system ATP-binding protein
MVNYWQHGDDNPAEIRAAEKVLEKVNASSLRDQSWATMSQGERQRVLIGRALMSQKMEILVLDEPCAGLDPVAREHYLQWMQSLAARPKSPSLVMVTHHVEEILPSITHCLLLKDGQVHASGPKHDLLTSANLSHLYGSPVKLTRHGERYSLRLA